ncbi:MAG: hypothetical protein IJ583_05215 [Firmicutes bacterium]|nr:hypothetical protein [Bacillota bacterium]
MTKINDDDLNNVSGGIKVEANISNNDSEISENTSDNNVSDKNLNLGTLGPGSTYYVPHYGPKF